MQCLQTDYNKYTHPVLARHDATGLGVDVTR